jgi:hypothetical protein
MLLHLFRRFLRQFSYLCRASSNTVKEQATEVDCDKVLPARGGFRRGVKKMAGLQSPLTWGLDKKPRTLRYSEIIGYSGFLSKKHVYV